MNPSRPITARYLAATLLLSAVLLAEHALAHFSPYEIGMEITMREDEMTNQLHLSANLVETLADFSFEDVTSASTEEIAKVRDLLETYLSDKNPQPASP